MDQSGNIEKVEGQVLTTLASLQKSTKESRFHDRVITAGFAAIATLAVWYAIQSTKPKDVLAQVKKLQADVENLKLETKPSDVLLRVNALQRDIIKLQETTFDLKQFVMKEPTGE